MTNSRTQKHAARQCLGRILGRLDSSVLSQAIDEPIDRAREAFHTTIQPPLDRETFDRLIAEFVRYLRRTGCRLRRDSSQASCWSDATRLLDSLGGSRGATGYELALLDVLHDACACMEDILVLLADAIKSVERSEYRAWVYATEIDSLDWDVKCRLVEVVMDLNGGELRGSLRGCNLDHLPHHLEALLETVMETESRVRGCAPSALFTPEITVLAPPLIFGKQGGPQNLRVGDNGQRRR